MRVKQTHRNVGLRPDQHDQLRQIGHDHRATYIQVFDAMLTLWNQSSERTRVRSLSLPRPKNEQRRSLSQKSPKPNTTCAA